MVPNSSDLNVSVETSQDVSEKDESVGPDRTGSLASGSGLQLGTELDCSGRTEGVTWLR